MNLQRINKLIGELEVNNEIELVNFYKAKRVKLIKEINSLIKTKINNL